MFIFGAAHGPCQYSLPAPIALPTSMRGFPRFPLLLGFCRASIKSRPQYFAAGFSRVPEIEATGLEPAASWSQTKHSTKLSYASLPCRSLEGALQPIYYIRNPAFCQPPEHPCGRLTAPVSRAGSTLPGPEGSRRAAWWVLQARGDRARSPHSARHTPRAPRSAPQSGLDSRAPRRRAARPPV